MSRFTNYYESRRQMADCHSHRLVVMLAPRLGNMRDPMVKSFMGDLDIGLEWTGYES